MPYYDNYGGGGGDVRDRITQALLSVQNPPPMTQLPQLPPQPQQQPQPQFAAGGAGMGGASPMSMPQAATGTPGAPTLAPSPMASAGASNPMLPGTMPGAQPSQLGAQQMAAQPSMPQY